MIYTPDKKQIGFIQSPNIDTQDEIFYIYSPEGDLIYLNTGFKEGIIPSEQIPSEPTVKGAQVTLEKSWDPDYWNGISFDYRFIPDYYNLGVPGDKRVDPFGDFVFLYFRVPKGTQAPVVVFNDVYRHGDNESVGISTGNLYDDPDDPDVDHSVVALFFIDPEAIRSNVYTFMTPKNPWWSKDPIKEPQIIYPVRYAFFYLDYTQLPAIPFIIKKDLIEQYQTQRDIVVERMKTGVNPTKAISDMETNLINWINKTQKINKAKAKRKAKNDTRK